jgi:plastocyanin
VPAPTATTTTPAPAPAPAQPEVQKLEDETSPAAPKATAAASTGVTIKDFDFGPATVTVNVGDTVTWTNQGPTGHSATAGDGAFDTGILDAGKSASHTFDTAGTFAYICTPHPFMKGTVVVQAASTQGGSGDTTGDSGSTAGTDSSASDDGPSLPSTGMDVLAIGLLGLLMLWAGVGVRRRSAAESPQPAGRIGW